MSELLQHAIGVLLVLAIAAGVRALSVRVDALSYPVLLTVGIAAPFLGFDPGFALSSELIMTILLPTILFQGAEATTTEHFPRSLPLALLLALVGVPIGAFALGG